MTSIVVNGFLINWLRAEATKDGITTPLEAKQLALLKALFLANGSIVSQQTLLEQVWQDSIVTPNTLQQTIAQLRKVLGDNGRSQNAIKTHPKLGYSLTFTIASQAPTKLNTSKNYLVFSFVALVLIVVLTINLTSQTKTLSPEILFSDYSPVTVNNEIVKSVTYDKTNEQLIYIESAQGLDSIVKRGLHTPQTTTIKQNLRLHGPLAVSPNGEALLYSKITLRQSKKCIDLYLLQLNTNQETLLVPCGANFTHSPKWLSNSEVLYLATDKKRNSKLHKLNLNNNTNEALALEHSHIKSFDVIDKLLLLLTNDSSEVYQLSASRPFLSKLYELNLEQGKPANSIRWLTQSRYVILGNEIITADIQESAPASINTELLGAQTVVELERISDTSFVTILEQENWDVRERNLTVEQDKTIGKTNLYEKKAKYKNHQEISFLSNRTNVFQVWSEGPTGLVQHTNTSSDIKDYLWSSDSNTLIYISDGQLWLQKPESLAKSVITDFKPLRLYQINSANILLSAKSDDNDEAESLISFNLNSNTTEVLIDKEVNWAQQISEDMFIINDEFGQLMKQQNGKLSYIEKFKKITLQWRYFWRQDNKGEFALYFQDKQQNIWRYNPYNEEAEVVAQFDENALFMTDFSATKFTMLSDNFVAEKRILVKLSSLTKTD